MSEYQCKVCERGFDDVELDITGNENECILHFHEIKWDKIKYVRGFDLFWSGFNNLIMRMNKEYNYQVDNLHKYDT